MRTESVGSETDLRDIDEVAARGEADEECIAEVKAVLERHCRLSRFGLLLLHSHFPVAADEVLVEECDHVSRTLTIRPKQKSTLTEVVVKETQWRLDSESALTSCMQICTYNQGDGGHASTSHLSE